MVARLFLAPFLLLALSAHGAESDNIGQSLRTRDKGQCAILLTQKGTADDTNGIKVAPLDLAKFSEFLEKQPALEGVIIVAGLPIYGKKKKEFIQQVRAMLKDYGFPEVPVKVVTEPKDTGWKRALEEARYFFPMSSDYQAPVLSEAASGFMVAATGNVSLALFAFHNFPAHIAIPMVATNAGLDLAASVYRRSISNWMNRSTGRPYEKFVKECLIGTAFTAGIYANSKIDAITSAFNKSNLPEFLCQIPNSVSQFAASQAPTIVANGLLFTLLFNGLYRWDQLRSTTPEGNALVRRTSPLIMAGLFAAIAPAFALAASSDPNMGIIPGIPWLNSGHLAMFGMAAVGSIAWMKPQIFDYVAPVVEKTIYAPLRFLKTLIGWPFRRNESPAQGG